MTYVPPSGSKDARFVVCGEAPAAEEVRIGRGFVGPSGKLLWPVMERLSRVTREDCWVTNLSKTPLNNDESAEAKMSPEEFEANRYELFEELKTLSRPYQVLAVGALAARAFLGDDYSRMEVHNGMTYDVGDSTVTPCWHPAAALRGAGEGKDPLAWMGDALAHWGQMEPRMASPLQVPPWLPGLTRPHGDVIAVDTEGTPDEPICLTWADDLGRYYIPAEFVPVWWSDMRMLDPLIIYHNAPWDWAVLEAMGVPCPEQTHFADTMELAYLRQTEPQGLKDLSYRHFGLRMRTWEEVVMPYYDETVIAAAAGRVEAGTTYETLTKTGKLRKKPIVHRTEDAKSLHRVATNVKLLRERMGYDDPLTLRYVPFAEMAEYATLDPWATLHLAKVLR